MRLKIVKRSKTKKIIIGSTYIYLFVGKKDHDDFIAQHRLPTAIIRIEDFLDIK